MEVEFSPIEPVWLEILVGFHAIRRFAQFVEIADSVAVAIGIKNPPHGFDHDEVLTDEFFNIFGAKTDFRVMLAGRVDLRKHVAFLGAKDVGPDKFAYGIDRERFLIRRVALVAVHLF